MRGFVGPLPTRAQQGLPSCHVALIAPGFCGSIPDGAGMLAAGCSRGLALGQALRAAPAARRALLVVCSAGRGEDPSRLTPSHLLTAGGRALTVLSGARQFEWRAVGKQLGGTLVVDDASHKEDVQKVPGGGQGWAGGAWATRSAAAAALRRRRLPPRLRPPCGPQLVPHPACLQAVREGNLSFGFSAGGCLFRERATHHRLALLH